MSNHISDLQALKAFNIIVGNLGHCPKVIEVIWSLFPMGWVKIMMVQLEITMACFYWGDF